MRTKSLHPCTPLLLLPRKKREKKKFLHLCTPLLLLAKKKFKKI
jgi:hypothetical protein